jgi:hypothetical protein
MRWVIVRNSQECAVCKEKIYPGEVAIQSEGRFYLFYHEDCHWERFGSSHWHRPRNEKPENQP